MSTHTVAPRAGAWIEITARERRQISHVRVAPRAGAWIEIINNNLVGLEKVVAPRAGAWIEILR